MKLKEIMCYGVINDTDERKVEMLKSSIRVNGYIGCPILVYGGQLLTGSHRLMALKQLAIEDNDDVDYYNMDVAEDVTTIVEDNYIKATEELGYAPDIEYDNIGWLLSGSWVEQYKDEIEEW